MVREKTVLQKQYEELNDVLKIMLVFLRYKINRI